MNKQVWAGYLFDKNLFLKRFTYQTGSSIPITEAIKVYTLRMNCGHRGAVGPVMAPAAASESFKIAVPERK
jgi:hypothetical protein